MAGKDLSKEEFQQVLESRPKGMSTDDAIRLAIKKGYTFGGKHVDPHTLIPYDDKLYSNHDEISTPRAAWEATKEALGTKIPGLAQFGEFLSQDAPEYISRHTSGSKSALVRGAGEVAGVGSIVASNFVPTRVGDVAAQALAGPVLKGTGAIGKAIAETDTAKGLEEFGTDLMSRAIGVAKPFIKNVKENTSVLKDISDNMQSVWDYATSLSNIMNRGVQRLGAHVRAVEDAFIEAKSANPDALTKISLDDLDKKITDIKLRKGVEPPKVNVGEGITINLDELITKDAPKKLSKIDAIVGSDAKIINTYHNEIKSIKDEADAIDLIRLKRRLGDDIAWGKGDEVAKKIGSQTNGILKQLYKDVKTKLHEISPELKGADEEYSKARQQYDILQNKVFGTSAEAAYQRTRLRIMRGVGPQSLIQRAAQISAQSEAAMKNWIDKVSAQQFEPTVRKGIGGGFLGVGPAIVAAGAAGTMMAGGEGLSASIAPIIADLGAAALTSPRLAAKSILYGEALSGAVKKGAEKVAEQGMATRATEQAVASQIGKQPTIEERLNQ